MSGKYKIDIPQSIAYLEGKGLIAVAMNPHTIRITIPGSGLKWDWFHTTGTLLRHQDGGTRREDMVYLSAQALSLIHI